MRLRLTEKFLWDLYKMIENKDKLMNSLISNKWYGFKGIEEIIWPDIYQTRDYYWDMLKNERIAKKKKEDFSRFIRHLKDRGYLNIKDLKNRKAVMITPKGMKRVFNIKMKLGSRKRRIDRKWQMVLFDIPEKKRKARDSFRKQLKYLGYKRLQRSIWVCPYNVSKYTQQLIKYHKLDRFVRLLLVEEVKI